MPYVQIALRRGKSADYHEAIMDSIYEAMRATFNVPEDDRFMTVSEFDHAQFHFSRNYRSCSPRSDHLVIIQITANDTRTLDMKRALFADIARRLGERPGIEPADVFINIVEVKKENWSLGDGLAQYA